jgi:hypothetical protein
LLAGHSLEPTGHDGRRLDGMPRDPFGGHDEPVTIEDDPAGGLRELLDNEVGEGDPETVAPVLDE